jgi:hypothetical protein
MKKTFITAFAAMMLSIPSFATENISSDEVKDTKKNLKHIKELWFPNHMLIEINLKSIC